MAFIENGFGIEFNGISALDTHFTCERADDLLKETVNGTDRKTGICMEDLLKDQMRPFPQLTLGILSALLSCSR